MSVTYPHMVTKYGTPADGTHYVQKGIPEPLRPQFGGIPTLRVKMPQRDLGLAYIASPPVYADLERQIAIARARSGDHMQVEILKFRSKYEKYAGKTLDKAGCKLMDDIVEWLLHECGGLSAAAQQFVIAAHKGDLNAALQTRPQPAQAVLAHQQIVGVAATKTPFKGPADAKGEDSYFRDFQASTTVGKGTLYNIGRTVIEFLAHCPLSLEELESTMPNGVVNTAGKAAVQKYLDDNRIARSLGKTSLQNRMVLLNIYWRWLYDHGKVTTEGWFHHRNCEDGRKPGYKTPKGRRGKGLAYLPSDVARIWQAAEAKGDIMLAAAFIIDAYSSLRRDGVCSLRVENVRPDPETGIRCFHVAEKTKAGVREVPIHPFIEPLIDWLCENPDENGYLIHDPGVNSTYGTHGHKIARRLWELLDELRIEDRGLHALRKNFSQALEDAGVPLKTIANLMGHVVKDQTVGVGKSRYGKMRPMNERFDAICKLEYPGATPIQLPQMGRRNKH